MEIFGYEYRYSALESDLRHQWGAAILHPIPHFRLITLKIINLSLNEGNLHLTSSFHSAVVMVA